MSRPLSIDFVAPPFAGHLYPLLHLATGARDRGYSDLRIMSTSSAMAAIGKNQLQAIELLPGRDAQVKAIVDPSYRIGSNPIKLWRQLRANLELMPILQNELEAHWKHHRPDLVVVDFAVPIAGLTAERMGIEWWTAIPTPCAIETRKGTPSYLGGWSPPNGLPGRCRDALGRQAVRTFKRTIDHLCRRQLRACSIPSVYRQDGSEVAYSPRRILGLGMRELEFDRDWPNGFTFIGPLTSPPLVGSSGPEIASDKRNVLVTLGTHLQWAKQMALERIEKVAAQMPECVFHFSRGNPDQSEIDRRGNVLVYDFLPYTQQLRHFDAAIIHCGTGIMYACIEHGVPSLVWPQDYDQFDHAARIVHRGLGLHFHKRPTIAAKRLRQLFEDTGIRQSLIEFHGHSRSYSAVDDFCHEVASLSSS